jgi:hypothetical protein
VCRLAARRLAARRLGRLGCVTHDAGVDVRRAVERIEDCSVASSLVEEAAGAAVLGEALVILHVHRAVLLLAREHTHLAREAQGLLQHIVRHHVKRLLLLALHVDGAAAIGVAHETGDVRA